VAHTQVDVIRANSISNEVKENAEKLRLKMNEFKRHHEQFELKATRAQLQNQKVYVKCHLEIAS